jgi:hypothetical protein
MPKATPKKPPRKMENQKNCRTTKKCTVKDESSIRSRFKRKVRKKGRVENCPDRKKKAKKMLVCEGLTAENSG